MSDLDVPELLPHRSWPELVMHVLAHVEGTCGLPSSVYDETYVAWAAEQLGPPSERILGEDAEALAAALPDHASLSQVQLLAWLFDDVDQAQACATRDLAELSPADVSRPYLLPTLRTLGPPTELLRCAALLESDVHRRLPPPTAAHAPKVKSRLAELVSVAPRLSQLPVMCLHALRLRGRVHGGEIWIGAPDAALDVDCDFVAWQAAHEATVAELSEFGAECGERDIEHVAVVLLCERAAPHFGEQHARWIAQLDAPSTQRASLGPAARRLHFAYTKGT